MGIGFPDLGLIEDFSRLFVDQVFKMGCGQTTDKGTVRHKPANAASATAANPFPLAAEAADPASPADHSISQRDTNVPPGRVTAERLAGGDSRSPSRTRKEQSSVHLLS